MDEAHSNILIFELPSTNSHHGEAVVAVRGITKRSTTGSLARTGSQAPAQGLLQRTVDLLNFSCHCIGVIPACQCLYMLLLLLDIVALLQSLIPVRIRL